jgi:hypothetical protein
LVNKGSSAQFHQHHYEHELPEKWEAVVEVEPDVVVENESDELIEVGSDALVEYEFDSVVEVEPDITVEDEPGLDVGSLSNFVEDFGDELGC